MGSVMSDSVFLFLYIFLFSKIFANKNDFRIKKRNKYYFKTTNKEYIRSSPHTSSVERIQRSIKFEVTLTP